MGQISRLKSALRLSFITIIYAAIAWPAAAQIRVDARIHSSSGSCASCDLSKRKMNGMRLQDSDFSGSLFNGSNLSGARFDRSNLSEAHFRKALLLRVVGDTVNMSGAMLQDATLTEATLTNSNLRETDFRRADLTRATFDSTDFTNSNLTSASAPDANFADSVFADARLNHINLENADLRGGIFKGARFGDALLTGAQIDGANLSGSDMRAVRGLTQVQLDTACGDATTRLPAGLSLPYCTDYYAEMSESHNRTQHTKLNPRMSRAASNLDDALESLEGLMTSPPASERQYRRQLETIHANISASRAAIESPSGARP